MRRVLRMSYLAAGIGGLGFFVISVLLLGVWPGIALEEADSHHRAGSSNAPHCERAARA